MTVSYAQAKAVQVQVNPIQMHKGLSLFIDRSEQYHRFDSALFEMITRFSTESRIGCGPLVVEVGG